MEFNLNITLATKNDAAIDSFIRTYVYVLRVACVHWPAINILRNWYAVCNKLSRAADVFGCARVCVCVYNGSLISCLVNCFEFVRLPLSPPISRAPYE